MSTNNRHMNGCSTIRYEPFKVATY